MGAFLKSFLYLFLTVFSFSVYAQSETTTTIVPVVQQPATSAIVVEKPAGTAAVVVEKPAATTAVVVEKPVTTNAVVVERPVIVTTIPAPRVENILTPANPAYCFWVENGWYGDVWVGRHRICHYKNNPGGTAWVEGYWTCNKYDLTEAKCTNWDWTSAHWASGVSVY